VHIRPELLLNPTTQDRVQLSQLAKEFSMTTKNDSKPLVLKTF